MKIGRGKILDNKGHFCIFSDESFEKGEEFLIISTKDAEEVIKHKLEMLLAQALPMEDFHWNTECPQVVEKCSECPHIADEIHLKAKDGTTRRLFLERKFYSHNPRDYLFIRYISVDQAEDEGDIPYRVEDVKPTPGLRDHPNLPLKKRDHPGQKYLF